LTTMLLTNASLWISLTNHPIKKHPLRGEPTRGSLMGDGGDDEHNDSPQARQLERTILGLIKFIMTMYQIYGYIHGPVISSSCGHSPEQRDGPFPRWWCHSPEGLKDGARFALPPKAVNVVEMRGDSNILN
jgi:hypothetical protein